MSTTPGTKRLAFRHTPTKKAPMKRRPNPPKAAEVHAVADANQHHIENAWRQSVAATQPNIAEATQGFINQSPSQVENAVPTKLGQDALVAAMSGVLVPIYLRTAEQAAESLPAAASGSGIGLGLSFKMTNPLAVSAARSAIGTRIAAIAQDQLQAVRAYVAGAIRQGIAPARAAKGLGQIVGLRPPQVNQVLTYRASLIADGRTAAEADTLTDQLAQRLMVQRGIMIARTEGIAAESLGQQAAWAQSAHEGLLDAAVEGKEWIATDDERTCDECLSLDGEIVGLDDSFSNGSNGPEGSHPNCRCTLGIANLPTGLSVV